MQVARTETRVESRSTSRRETNLGTRTERIDAVINWLRPVAAPVEGEAEFSRWIGARYAETEQSEDWCAACARAEVERLNMLHPEHEYLVDGGWGSLTDSPPYCCKCGKSLDDHFTQYAIEEEVQHYAGHSVTLRGKCAAEHAFRFLQVLRSANFNEKAPENWRFFRKVERMGLRRQARGACEPSLLAQVV